jgi:Flp pilus assembly protein TadG
MNGRKANSVFMQSITKGAAFDRLPLLRRRRISRGQSMVEFALIAPLAIVMLVVGVQYAIIGSAYLGLGQAASTLARYAAVHPSTMGTNGGVTLSNASAPGNLLSPSICPDNNCSNLTVSINSYSPANTNTQTNSPKQTDRLLITLTYDATNKIALPNPFMHIPGIFPGITFPTSLTYTDSQIYE